ncbi:MAG: FprA family A-type flavoprotein [Anaeroplasma sp.]|nr:FprA family A-type flavoprotein [Anaeroplasma sp.]
MIEYIGVNDHKIDLFEGQYKVKNGMSYNSYVIIDEKIAVLDTVDRNFSNEWLVNLESKLDGRIPDYLVIHHMEPDHSANIKIFMDKYPNACIVSSVGAFNMMKNLFKTDFSPNKLVVKENDVLDLGNHKLIFISAPLVHWPEVMFSYDSYEKVLFSADGFGKFGALDVEEEWDNEARRYYSGIVGKFGKNVLNVLKKASSLEIKKIYPLHGPLLEDNLSHYISLYEKWASYQPEEEGVVICYTSVYGNTKNAVELLKDKLNELNKKYELFDLSRDDSSEALSTVFKYDKVVLATTTYNGTIFPAMKEFIDLLVEHNFQNRKVALIENGMWAPTANKVMTSLLEGCANLDIISNITIKGSLDEANEKDIIDLANNL